MGYDAVLMLGFGGPASVKEVEPFITRVVRGRSVSPERIAQVVDQYRQIGGKSPFRKLTERQARALSAALARKGQPMQVYVGLLFSPPLIDDAVSQMVADGVSRAVGIVMAPHRSEASFDRYVHAVGRALEKCADAAVSVDFVASWHRHPLFVEAVAERVRKVLDCIGEASWQSTWVVFTAHSIPLEMPGASQYDRHVRESAELAAAALKLPEWQVAFQSRTGNPAQPWLEPDVRDLIRKAAAGGVANVVVVPIGFVCDHVEVLFDLDIQAATVAREHGVNMLRAETVGDHPKFIELLADLVLPGRRG